MSRAKKILISPDPRLRAVLGIDDASSTGEVLALIANEIEHGALILADQVEWSRAKWCMLADAANGLWLTPGMDLAEHLAANLTDAQALGDLAGKWDQPETAVGEIIVDLADLPQSALRAIWLALRFFWAHPEIPTLTVDWWTPAFRARWQQREQTGS